MRAEGGATNYRNSPEIDAATRELSSKHHRDQLILQPLTFFSDIWLSEPFTTSLLSGVAMAILGMPMMNFGQLQMVKQSLSESPRI